MTSPDPLRPDALETVFVEPDEARMLAVVPGALWLAPGDVVELDAPPRDARVLSSRLQLREGTTRVLVILDVPAGDDALRGEVPTEAVLGVELDEPGPDLADELAALGSAPDGTPDEPPG